MLVFDLGLAQKVVILEPDTAEFTYSDSAYCENSANQLPIFTASSDLGGVFSINPATVTFSTSTGQINVTTGTPTQSYIIEYASPSVKCPAPLFYDTVLINPNPTATLAGGDTVCQGDSVDLTLTLTGTSNWSFLFDSAAVLSKAYTISANSHTFTVGDSGTYRLTSLSDSNCAATILGTPQRLVTLMQDTSDFTYSDSAYCENAVNQLPIFTPSSDLGGVFSISPTSVTFNSAT